MGEMVVQEMEETEEEEMVLTEEMGEVDLVEMEEESLERVVWEVVETLLETEAL
jgi:hypothetical protein